MTPQNENKNLFVIDAKSCLGAIETHLMLVNFVEEYLFNFVDKCINFWNYNYISTYINNNT